MHPKFIYNRAKKTIKGKTWYQMLAIGNHGVCSIWIDKAAKEDMVAKLK